MKTILATITLVISFNANAFVKLQKCGLPENTAQYEELENSKIKKNILELDFQNDTFTAVEKKMILASNGTGLSKNEFLEDFYRQDGYIKYFTIKEQLFAEVAYYPGDNQYGSIYKIDALRKGIFKEIAVIGDGEIQCR